MTAAGVLILIILSMEEWGVHTDLVSWRRVVVLRQDRSKLGAALEVRLVWPGVARVGIKFSHII